MIPGFYAVILARLRDARQLCVLEQHRRLDEHVKDKHHGADEEDEELHWNLGHGIEQQADPAFHDRAAGEVPLHLRLVAPEVRQKQKRAAYETAPDIEAVVPIEVGGDGVEAAGGPGEIHGIAERDRVRQQHDDGDERNPEAEEDDAHLLHVRPGDGLDAANHRVTHHGHTHQHGGGALRPSQNYRQHDGWRVDGEPRGNAALAQEDDTGQRAGLGVEPVFQVFIRGIDAGAIKNRHHHGRDHDHGDGQSEVSLHEAHAIHVRLAGGGDKRDGAGLGGHDGERHGVPRHGFAGEQVAVHRVAAAAAVQAVGDDGNQRREQDHPIQGSHR